MSVTTVSNVSAPITQVGGEPSRGAKIAKHALIGGALGAAAGAGLSFTALPFVGALTAPIAAAIGGVAGLVVGSVIGLFRTRGTEAPRTAAAMLQGPPPPSTSSSSQLPPPPPSTTV